MGSRVRRTGKTSPGPVPWDEDTFGVGGLGAATATGTFTRGSVRSVPGSCSIYGTPLEFHAYFRFHPDGTSELLEMSAGSTLPGERLSDEDLREAKDLVAAAVSEWYPEDGLAMVGENNRRDRSAASRGAALAARELRGRRAAILESMSSPESVAHMERAITELKEVEAALADRGQRSPT